MVTKSSVARVILLIGILTTLTLLLHNKQAPADTSMPDLEDEIDKRYDDSNQTGSNDVDTEGKQLYVSRRGNTAESCKSADIHNFFTDMKHSFTGMMDSFDEPLNTRHFLDCCIDLAKVFDRLGTAMMPVRSNIQKNIQVITKRYNSDRQKFSLLVSIIKDEAAVGKHKQSESVTDSILWLARSIMLMAEMFKHLKTEDNFPKVVSLAYEATIKQYHNFIVRGIFSMIAPAVPSKESVMLALAITEADNDKPGYNECLYDSIAIYNEGVIAVCEEIRKLLASFDIVLLHKP